MINDTNSAQLKALLLNSLPAEKIVNIIDMQQGTNREHYKQALLSLSYLSPANYDEVMLLIPAATKAQWQVQLKILELRGEGRTMLMGEEKKIVEKQGKDMQEYEDEIHQMREVMLPRDPIILDEIQHQDHENLNFVRLEKYDHGCKSAFLIKDYDEHDIAESNKLRQGYRLTFSQYDFET